VGARQSPDHVLYDKRDLVDIIIIITIIIIIVIIVVVGVIFMAAAIT